MVEPSIIERWRRRLRTPDGRAVSVLVAVIFVVFVVPALFNYPAVAGDNLIQNFPLRALSGQFLRAGHLPTWNPYIWSGSPLLGGLNAGALYPFTLVFAVLPPVAAWVVNLLVAYWAGALGMYALVRQYRLAPLAAFLAALIYSFTGAMAGQLVHLPIVQGMALVPWMILAQLRLAWAIFGAGPASASPVNASPVSTGPAGASLARASLAGNGPAAPPAKRSPWPWATLLAAVVGLVLLTGEPRGIAEVEVVSVVVTLWLAVRSYGHVAVRWQRRLWFVVLSGMAGAWGAAIGLVQLLPGLQFITESQRATSSYQFFGGGSLHTQWTVLLLVPDLFGGAGSFSQPTFFNDYNLPEVTGYVGLLPLVAAFALLARSFGRRRDPAATDWSLWLGLATLGLFLSWGVYTPLGHLFFEIPFYSQTRLQSRSLGIVDLALAVLFAFWADRWLSSHPERAGLERWRRWVAAAPPLATVVLLVVGIAVPISLDVAFGASSNGGNQLQFWYAGQLLVAVAVAATVLGWRRLDQTARRRLLVGLVLMDLAFFTISSATGYTPGKNTVLQPSRAVAAPILGTTGRFAIYDTTASYDGTLSQIGETDQNVFTQLPSVGGYGSLVNEGYTTATGSHFLDTLDSCALGRGVFDPLRLSTVLALGRYFAPILPPPTFVGPVPLPPPACPGVRGDGTATQRTWYFGQILDVQSLALLPSGSQSGPIGEVGLLGTDGRITWPASRVRAVRGDGWQVRFASPEPAAGVVVRGHPRLVSDNSVVTVVGGTRYALNGVLQDSLGQSATWRFTGFWQNYVRFVRTHVRPPVWLQGRTAGSSARQIATTITGGERDLVSSPRPVVLVRSEAAAPGWQAVFTPAAGGPSRTVTVGPAGLVQSVPVPAGRWIVSFRYHAPYIDVGLLGSAVGLVGLLAVGVLALLRRRDACSAPQT